MEINLTHVEETFSLSLSQLFNRCPPVVAVALNQNLKSKSLNYMCTWGCPGERGSGMRRSTISSSWGELKKVSLNAAEPSLSDPICAFEIESEKFQEPNVLPFQMISLVWHSGRWMMAAGRGLWNFLGSLTLQSLSSAGCSRELARQRNFWGMVQSLWLSLWKEKMKISLKTGVLFHWCMHTQHCLELMTQKSC